jgi:hypothetical protein
MTTTSTTAHAMGPEMLRGAAHLLRSPLGVILGLATTLRDYDHRVTAEQRRAYLGDVLEAVAEINTALDGLSLLSRVLTGTLSVSSTAILADELACKAQESLSAVWRVDPVVAVGDTLARFRLDRQRTGQALQALARGLRPVPGISPAVSVTADPGLRIGPLLPPADGNDTSAVLHGPRDTLNLAEIIARPGAWELLLARLLFESQGIRLDLEPAGETITARLVLPLDF